MVTPAEVLSVARRLSELPGEAPVRAAVSRAYYAAFVHVRSLAEGDIDLTTTARDHERLEQWLRRRHAESVYWFAAMRILRNRADYDTRDDIAPGTGTACIAAAQRILRLAPSGP